MTVIGEMVKGLSPNFASNTEAVYRRCYLRNMFLQISQNSLENTCARVSFLIKLQASEISQNSQENTCARVSF